MIDVGNIWFATFNLCFLAKQWRMFGQCGLIADLELHPIVEKKIDNRFLYEQNSLPEFEVCPSATVSKHAVPYDNSVSGVEHFQSGWIVWVGVDLPTGWAFYIANIFSLSKFLFNAHGLNLKAIPLDGYRAGHLGFAVLW